LGWLPAVGLTAVVCFAAALDASWHGMGGRGLTATLITFSFYLGVQSLFAAAGVCERFAYAYGAGAGFLLGAAALLAYLIYALGTNGFAPWRAGVAAGFVFIPLALESSAERKVPGAWQDYVTLGGIWVLVKFYLPGWLWPGQGGRLSYILTTLLAVNVALASFLLVRRLGNVGYLVGWGRHWTLWVFGSFLLFAAVAIPLGTAIHFVHFEAHRQALRSLPWTASVILLFIAWPEEFLFRGLLQNMLTKSLGNRTLGLLAAALAFGLSHVTNGVFPNWRYVVLGSIAGLFYGWTWKKTGSIFASALVHAAVDVTWRLFFRTL
jgi:membrane protease YdiL (CAAX protease family)